MYPAFGGGNWSFPWSVIIILVSCILGLLWLINDLFF